MVTTDTVVNKDGSVSVFLVANKKETRKNAYGNNYEVLIPTTVLMEFRLLETANSYIIDALRGALSKAHEVKELRQTVENQNARLKQLGVKQ